MGMEYLLDRKGERRLAAYFDRIGGVLRTAPQRTSFATYAIGLMGDGEGKKAELGLEMIERAVADGLPAGLVLTDSAYGDNTEFRRRVRCEGLDYAVGLHCTTTVWRLDSLGRRTGSPVAVGDLAAGVAAY